MKKTMLCLGILFALALKTIASEFDVAAIVWPAYHPEPRWKELGIFEHGNGEWQNVYEARPKKEGDFQPRVPLWGYENEADPIAVARKIDAALAAGINVFVYDWYWYQNRPFLEGALNNGFLKAPNNERMKFYIMWANHDVDNTWNNKIANKRTEKPLFDAAVDYEEFTKVLVPRFIEYFKKPNYYKMDGKPVFWLYLPSVFVKGIGSPEKAKEALDYLRAETKKAGFPGLHLQFCFRPYVEKPAKIPGMENPTHADALKYYGVDSITAYNWNTLNPELNKGWYKDGNDEEFSVWAERALSRFDEFQKLAGNAVYYPNASLGWDNNARWPQNHRNSVTLNATPEKFEKYLRQTKDWAEKNIKGRKLIIINSWNEWTEGSYLEPDTKYGYGFLNACAKIFMNQ